MERSLLNQVDKKSLSARLKSNNIKQVYYPNFFGSKAVDTLKWETLIGEKGVPVMADVVSMDSPAPIKSRETITKASGDIPKISVKRGMIESEFIKYNNLVAMAGGDATKKSLIDLAFNDVDFCFNGVRSRKEWLGFQALSKGELTLTNQNNAGVTTPVAVDFGIPTANKTAVGTVWTNKSSATPIADLKAKYKAAKEAGVKTNYAIMDEDDVDAILLTDEAKDLMKYWINGDGKMLMSLTNLNAYLKAEKLPQIVTIDPTVRFESKNNKRSIQKCWNSGYVALLPQLNVGNFQYGPLAVESSESAKKNAVMVKNGDTLVMKYSHLDPFREWTSAEANTFPVLDDPYDIFLMKVNGTAW